MRGRSYVSCRAGKIVFILVKTLDPSLNYSVAKFDNLFAKSTMDNIHIMIAGRILAWSLNWLPKIESQAPQTNRQSPNWP